MKYLEQLVADNPRLTQESLVSKIIHDSSEGQQFTIQSGISLIFIMYDSLLRMTVSFPVSLSHFLFSSQFFSLYHILNINYFFGVKLDGNS